MDILRQPKFKGDVHEDKPLGQYQARQKPSSGFAGLFGGAGAAVAEPMFRKSQHGHGSVKNKIKETW